MWGCPRISAWSSADSMCPLACTDSRAKTPLRTAGLTGHLISTWGAPQAHRTLAFAAGRHAPLREGAQQAEAAGEHHVAIRRRVLERQRAAGEQGAARSRREERQRGQVDRLRRGGQHGSVAAVFA